MKLTAKAPAKINLTLDILGRRADGYHDVSMLMQAVSLYETVTVIADANENPNENGEITITCDKEGVPLDSSNIAYKAAKAFFKYTELIHGNIEIDIKKEIPFGAGLAGGSADGAAVIVLLNRIYNTGLREKELCAIGERVGADVPFCIVGGTYHATETGTTLKKLRGLPSCHIVICKPEIAISTAEAYRLADKRTAGQYSYTQLCIPALYSGSVRNVADFLHNDFEEVLNLEEINKVKKIMHEDKCLGCAMSGSGSAVFALFLNEKQANKCAKSLREAYNEVFVVEPLKHGVQILPEDVCE